MSVPSYDAVEAGQHLRDVTLPITRADLVRYAGASGDFNPIHWSERTALAVGLPDVIAHGMLTMAKAANLLTDWVGDPARILEYGTRFGQPVEVPDSDDPSELVVTAKIGKKLEDKKVRIDIDARAGDQKVLSMARAIVKLD
ncbi:MaoC family dehydratase [Cumulibacter soli]|uniref:MaoC family dehydratase n=1 Tax=Cumulibacter soli TaxID=2546344 RepID=UPI0010683B49|nr:MaoC family dehydratase [Cumulibacter soli]